MAASAPTSPRRGSSRPRAGAARPCRAAQRAAARRAAAGGGAGRNASCATAHVSTRARGPPRAESLSSPGARRRRDRLPPDPGNGSMGPNPDCRGRNPALRLRRLVRTAATPRSRRGRPRGAGARRGRRQRRVHRPLSARPHLGLDVRPCGACSRRVSSPRGFAHVRRSSSSRSSATPRSPELRERILATFDPDALEDLYHPYRHRRRTARSPRARRGSSRSPTGSGAAATAASSPRRARRSSCGPSLPQREKGVPDAKSAIEGARDILVERLRRRPSCARSCAASTSRRAACARRGRRRRSRTRASRLFRVRGAGRRCCASRSSAPVYLALRRGQAEDELQLSLGGAADDPAFETRLVQAFEAAACGVPDSPGAEVLRHAGRIALKNDVRTAIENEVHRVLKDAADAVIAAGFAESARRRLLAAPFGARAGAGRRPRPARRLPARGARRLGRARREPRRPRSRPTSRRRRPARSWPPSRGSTEPRRSRSATAPAAATSSSWRAPRCARQASTRPSCSVSESGRTPGRRARPRAPSCPTSSRACGRRSRSGAACRTRSRSSSSSSRRRSARASTTTTCRTRCCCARSTP